MHEVDGVEYLTTEEVKSREEFGWSRDSLYRLKRAGVIQPYHFFGDTHTYWQITELRQAKTRPFKAGELRPKTSGGMSEQEPPLTNSGANGLTALAPA